MRIADGRLRILPGGQSEIGDPQSATLRNPKSDIHNHVSEPRLPFRASTPRLSEHALQALWHARPWGAIALTTRDGRALRVLHPGRWSQDGGPDFQQAVLEVDGRTVAGDVEIHLRTSDWDAHGHVRDPAYAHVALHVVLEDDDRSPWTRGPTGIRIPKIVVGSWVRQLVASAPKGLPEAVWLGPGACRGTPIDEVRAVALLKGSQRIARRAAEIAARAAATSPEQAAWEALAEGLGYARNAAPFLRLARRVPLEDLRTRIASLGPAERLHHAEGVLLGAAGLLPADGSDDEARQRLRTLREAFYEHAEEWDAGGLRPGEWTVGGTRPENSPVRRVAALAAVAAGDQQPRFARGGLVDAWARAVEEGADPASWLCQGIDLLRIPADAFWSRRCGFSGRTLSRATALVGPDRALVLAVNALVPSLLALREGLFARVQSLLAILPSPAPNRLTRLAGYRILSSSAPPPMGALEEQGRLQLAAEGCQWGREGCARCPLARSQTGPASLAPRNEAER